MTETSATPVPQIDTAIYGMPLFVSLEVTDLVRSRDCYVDTLDFIVLATIPGPDGSDVLVHLRRWRYQDILLAVARGPVRPGRGLSLVLAAQEVSLGGLAERARQAGAAVVGPADSAWNTADLTVTDPDGYRITYTAPRPAERRDRAFESMIEALPRVR